MLLKYNFIEVHIADESSKWEKYISEILSDQIDLSCQFAKITPLEETIKIEIHNIDKIGGIKNDRNIIHNLELGVAIQYLDNVLIYYCGFSRSISLSYLINLAMLFSRRGMLVHCAAVEDKLGNGHVYSALGGVGKTQLALKFVRDNDFRFEGVEIVNF
jgi:hypothetical protein